MIFLLHNYYCVQVSFSLFRSKGPHFWLYFATYSPEENVLG